MQPSLVRVLQHTVQLVVVVSPEVIHELPRGSFPERLWGEHRGARDEALGGRRKEVHKDVVKVVVVTPALVVVKGPVCLLLAVQLNVLGSAPYECLDVPPRADPASRDAIVVTGGFRGRQSGAELVAGAQDEGHAVRDYALEHSKLGLDGPRPRIAAPIVDQGLAKRISDSDHVPPAELVHGIALAAEFVQRLAIDPHAVAAQDLVSLQVHREHVAGAVAPPRARFELFAGKVALLLQRHCRAAHECLKLCLAGSGRQVGRVHFFGAAGAGQVGRVDAGPDHGALAVPVHLDQVRTLGLLRTGGRISRLQ